MSQFKCDDGYFLEDDSDTDNDSLQQTILQDLTLYAISNDDDSTVTSDNEEDSTCSSFDFDEYSSSNEGDDDVKLSFSPPLRSLLSDLYFRKHEDFASHESLVSLEFRSLLREEKAGNTKQVRFGEVTVREYSVTVGAFTATDNLCPLQLDWEHTSEVTIDSSKLGNFNRVRRLSVDQRRRRIAEVRGLTVEDIYAMETSLVVMDKLKHAMDLQVFNKLNSKDTPIRIPVRHHALRPQQQPHHRRQNASAWRCA